MRVMDTLREDELEDGCNSRELGPHKPQAP